MKVIYTASRNLYPYLYPSIISLLVHNDVERIYLLLEDRITTRDRNTCIIANYYTLSIGIV